MHTKSMKLHRHGVNVFTRMTKAVLFAAGFLMLQFGRAQALNWNNGDLVRQFNSENKDSLSSVPAAISRPAYVAAFKPKVYLAGAWGFFDFNANKKAYGAYHERTKNDSGRSGLNMLKLIGEDISKMGYAVLNPWTDTIAPAYIDGVMFGEGKDLEGRPWSDGSLIAGTLSKDRLLYWISIIAKDPRVTPSEYSCSPDSQFKELEEVYRNMVGDIVYRGNKSHVENADIVFANLNAYRGDADDGTLWEFMHALQNNKEVVVLADETPEKSLGEGIFGRNNRWNMMISGYMKENRGRVHVYHDIDDVLVFLRVRAQPSI